MEPCPAVWDKIGDPGVRPQAHISVSHNVRLRFANLAYPGDMVLDPFADCATACVAAERLKRQWVGIDLSPVAASLVVSRLREEGSLLFPTHKRTDIPRRTDLGKLPSYKTHKHQLFGRQEGGCAGCRVAFPFRNMTIDHIVPQSKGDTDPIDNLQLLGGACNSLKGNRDQARFRADLKARGTVGAE